jgi:predicted polyphosphate/ATP-dependent NAD kinase
MNVHPARPGETLVGVIANPSSGHDIRRLVARASVFPNTEKVMMLHRLLTSLAAVGVHRVVSATDGRGIAAALAAAIEARHPERDPRWPQVEFLDQPITGGAADSIVAADALVRLGARVLLVLGGDGTDRAVASACGEIPIAAVSTGTNNAFAPIGEATVVGIAAGLLATERLPVEDACRRNKALIVEHGSRQEVALVDVAATTSSGVGARAVWDPSTVTDLYVTFADPAAVGLSAIAGLTRPVGRDEPFGLRLALRPAASRRVLVPIAPGLVAEVGVDAVDVIPPGERLSIAGARGVVAIDGERELEFDQEPPTVTLTLQGPWSLDVARTMRLAASRDLLAID